MSHSLTVCLETKLSQCLFHVEFKKIYIFIIYLIVYKMGRPGPETRILEKKEVLFNFWLFMYWFVLLSTVKMFCQIT